MAGKSRTRSGVLKRLFPEKRIFLKSDDGTRFVRLGSREQLLASVAGTAMLAWCVVATSVLVIGLVSGGGAREDAMREQALYEIRLNNMAVERDRQTAVAIEAQNQFSRALEDVSLVQEQLFDSQLRIDELEGAADALRNVLQTVLSERDRAATQLAAMTQNEVVADPEEAAEAADTVSLHASLADTERTLAYLTGALERTAVDRDQAQKTARSALSEATLLRHESRLASERHDRIFAQLEEAVTVSMQPLDGMFKQAGHAPEEILNQMRQRYRGQGGPLTPIALSTMGAAEVDPDTMRANTILANLEELNVYRMAVDKLPFASPVRATVRQTSGFGYRRDPVRGGTRLHAGMDWAGAYGTPIFATADGVIVHAGWQSGYGRLIKIQHEFGIETRFAHLSKINVRVGQRVSRGDKIGAMGNSGRSTGTHLHYEVRSGGKPTNPQTYIKAARDVL